MKARRKLNPRIPGGWRKLHPLALCKAGDKYWGIVVTDSTRPLRRGWIDSMNYTAPGTRVGTWNTYIRSNGV